MSLIKEDFPICAVLEKLDPAVKVELDSLFNKAAEGDDEDRLELATRLTMIVDVLAGQKIGELTDHIKSQTYLKSLEVVEGISEKGNLLGIVTTARAYMKGWGGEPDMQKASYWFEKAAKDHGCDVLHSGIKKVIKDFGEYPMDVAPVRNGVYSLN